MLFRSSQSSMLFDSITSIAAGVTNTMNNLFDVLLWKKIWIDYAKSTFVDLYNISITNSDLYSIIQSSNYCFAVSNNFEAAD